MRLEKFNNSFFFLLFVINAITLLFNIFLSLVISYELTFDLDYYTSAHNGIKYSFFFYLITMYRGLGYSELKAKEKQMLKQNAMLLHMAKQQCYAMLGYGGVGFAYHQQQQHNKKPIARVAPSLK